MVKRKRPRREYAHQGSTLWIDEETGYEFFREPSWKPSDDKPSGNYSRPRKWRKVMENW